MKERIKNPLNQARCREKFTESGNKNPKTMEKSNRIFSILGSTPDKQERSTKSAQESGISNAPKLNKNLGIDLTLKDKLVLIKAICDDDDTGYRDSTAYAARSILYVGPMRRSLATMSSGEKAAVEAICERTIPAPEWAESLRSMCLSIICGDDFRYIDSSSEYDFTQMCYEAFFVAVDTANCNDPQSAKDFVGGIKMAVVDFLDEGLYAAALNTVNMLPCVEFHCKDLIREYEYRDAERLFNENDE